MNASCRRVIVTVVVGMVVACLAGGGQCSAADDPAQPLQPIPAQSNELSAGQELGSSLPCETPACDDDCVSYCDLGLCAPPGRFWLRADYLAWWTSGTNLPVLVASNALSTNPTIYYGGDTVLNDYRSGVRTTVGMWLDPCRVWNLEFDYLALGENSDHFSMTSTGSPTVARPFYNMQTGESSRQWVAYPGRLSGTVSVDVKDYFQSAGALVSYRLCSGNCCGESCEPCDDSCGPPTLYCCRTDFLAGFRFYNLSDRLGIQENLTMAVGSLIDLQDRFSANNEFYGSEVGLRSQIYRGRWSLEVLAKLAIGNTHRTVTIDGQTWVDGAPMSEAGGVMALSTNSGTHHSDAFTVIPQLGVELGYQWTRHWRTYLGYNLIYWGSVMRSADQIDTNIDPRNFPGVDHTGALPFPAYTARTTDYWAQGANLGMEFRF